MTPRDRLERMVSIGRRATRFWLVAGVVFALGCALSLAIAVTRPRTYRSETLILYREGIRQAAIGGPDTGGDPARKLGLRLKEMVLSRTQLTKLIEEFKLYPRIVEDRGYVEAVDEMRKHIAFRVQDGDTFGLSFEGDNPERVQRVTAKLADGLIDENSRNRTEQVEVTKDFLDAEKLRAVEDLRTRETNLAKFLAQHPEFARDTAQATNQAGTAVRTAGERQKANARATDPQLLALEREAARISERLGMPSAKQKRAAATDPKLLSTKQDAETELAAAQRELSDRAAQFTDEHPDVRAAKARVKTAEIRLKRAVEALSAFDSEAQKRGAEPSPEEEGSLNRAALENELKRIQEEIVVLRSRARREDGAATASNNSAASIVALETDWTRLNREASEARERTRQLEDKQFRASMAASSVSNGRNDQMTVVDPAYKPMRPSKASRSLIAGAGGAISFLLALALALACALLDDRLYDRADIEQLVGVPFLAEIPRSDEKKTRRRARVG